MIRLLLSVLAGSGVSLIVLDRLQPARPGRGRPAAGGSRRAARTGGFAVGAAALCWLIFGAPLITAAGAAGAVLIPRALADRARRRRADRLVAAWPRLLDEARVLCGPGGLSLPHSLFTAGRSAPVELRRAWASAEQAWRLSTDLPRALRVVEHELQDPTTDLVCATLEVIHDGGGPAQHEQLARLARDRRRDAAARHTAESELAGARFSRRFVLIVPLGMALAGQSVGTGRAAFQSPAGQLAALTAVLVTGACWFWSGRLLDPPLPSRPRP